MEGAIEFARISNTSDLWLTSFIFRKSSPDNLGTSNSPEIEFILVAITTNLKFPLIEVDCVGIHLNIPLTCTLIAKFIEK